MNLAPSASTNAPIDAKQAKTKIEQHFGASIAYDRRIPIVVDQESEYSDPDIEEDEDELRLVFSKIRDAIKAYVKSA